MPKDVPFDVWQSEEIDPAEVVEGDAVEELAMHLDPDSALDAPRGPHWSELTEEAPEPPAETPPVSYFGDEQPEMAADPPPAEDVEPDLEEILERQHYAFPPKG